MGRALGNLFVMDQQIATLTCGDRTGTNAGDVTCARVNGADQSGTSLILNNTSGASVTFNTGDRFTIASVYSVNPESKVANSTLQQFVVTADATASGSAVTLSISPEIITSGARQTVSNSPANTAGIKMITGVASSSHPQNLLFHKDAFTLASADLYLPEGVDMRSRASSDGLSVRIVRDYVINTDDLVCRADILYGWASLYPQWSCAVIG
jgi:hypothetical protein